MPASKPDCPPCPVAAAMNASLWAREQERFADFAAIKDDRCPCCGGPVVVEDVGRGLVLKATRT